MLKIDIKPSRQFIVLMLFFILSSEFVTAFLPVHFSLKIALGFILLFYGAWILFHQGWLLGKNAILRLEEREEDWLVVTRSEDFSAAILGSSTLTTRLCVLQFKSLAAGKVYHCVLFRDSLPKNLFRAFLVSVRS